MKKKWLWALALALLIPVVALSGCVPEKLEWGRVPSSMQISLESGQQTGIWVTGEGEVTAVPDIATLRLGIEATKDTVEEAQASAAEAMDGVMEALDDNGVDEKDIQTEYFSVHQVTTWDDRKDEEVVIGYRVINMVTVKVRDVEEVTPIIDDVIEAGGDLIRVDDISFSVDDISLYHRVARSKAMADAETKAEQLARLAGVSLGKPTYISESIYMPFPYPRMAVMEMAAPAAMPETPISPGEAEITLTVQVAYVILD